MAPDGRFVYGIHKPRFRVANLRESDRLDALGRLGKDVQIDNSPNFPPGDVEEKGSDWIYEIPNPFPFKGATYILKSWADEKSRNLSQISLSPPVQLSFSTIVQEFIGEDKLDNGDIDRFFHRPSSRSGPRTPWRGPRWNWGTAAGPGSVWPASSGQSTTNLLPSNWPAGVV